MMTAITVATETSAGKQEGGGGEGKAAARGRRANNSPDLEERHGNMDNRFIWCFSVSGHCLDTTAAAE